MPFAPGTVLGPYRLAALLGAGGMGEVYRAHDPRLGREVAIKVLPADVSRNPERRLRFEREARAIASLQHPHICALYDIGRHEDTDFLVMELLDGESLAERLRRGPLTCAEALEIAGSVLRTLHAVHERGFVHRDIKPANIFLATHGVKLLDFGLARVLDATADADTALTQRGVVLGTPRYMAPEQLRGLPVDHRADLFSVAAVIFEMLTGQAPFDGTSLVEILHAIAYEEPRGLDEREVPAGVAQVLRQALAKRPEDRPPTARALAEALAAGAGTSSSTATAIRAATSDTGVRRGPTRVIVAPFRVLRPDPDTDFLGFSLADAVSAALAGLDSIVVRSTLSAAQWAGAAPDLRVLAEQAQVDVALTGSLMRAGDQVRVAAQLVEVPGGSLLWSHTVQAPVQDLFQLQDALAMAIVSSLHVPLTAPERGRLRQDVPANASAYELYLRGNQLMTDSSRWDDVRELYERAVALDPGYAPAWARLGRVLRVIAKYGSRDPEGDRARAERAFQRALALNPDLALAHHLYAHLEVELGRAQDAMTRLLARARARPADADLLAGLVTACRYCGLLDASVAAGRLARRADPAARTSVAFTHYLLGDDAAAIEADATAPIVVGHLARARSGQTAAAIEGLAAVEHATPQEAIRLIALTYRTAIERKLDELLPGVAALGATSFRDPEGLYLLATWMAYAGAGEGALEVLRQAITGGFWNPAAMRADAFFDGVRDTPAFVRMLAEAEAAHARARDAFVSAGGPSLLGA